MFCMFASEAASAVGMNRNRSPAETLEAIWKRYYGGESYHQAKMRLERLSHTSPDSLGSVEDRVDALLASDADLQAALLKCVEDSNRLAISTVMGKIKKNFDAAVSERSQTQIDNWSVTPSQVIKCVRQKITRDYGSREEKNSIALLEKTTGTEVTSNNTQFYKKIVGQSPNGHMFAVGGRIDGLLDGKLIEIKNRRSRFMTPLPVYDIIQLHCYMHLLGLTSATLVEHLKKRGAVESRTTHVEWDQTLWDEVVKRIGVFTDILHTLLTDESAQHRLLTASDEYEKQDVYFHLANMLHPL